MASASMIPTESAVVSFNLLNSPFPVVRKFFNIMPLSDLYDLRRIGENVNSLSRFRGEIVPWINILTDTVKPWNTDQTSYSKFMNRPTPTKPYGSLKVMMGPDVNPKALLAKIEEQRYYNLYIGGEYNWKDVIAFLHADVSTLCLYDHMDLPEEDMEQFFKLLINFKIYTIQFCGETSNEMWFDAANKTWQSMIGTVLKTVEVRERYNTDFDLVATTADGATTKLFMNLLVDVDDDEEDEEFFEDEFDDDEFDNDEHLDADA